MKRFLILFAFLWTGATMAQTTAIWNADFENWDTLRGNVLAPHQWTTLDTLLTGYQTVTPSTNAYSGKYAARISPQRSIYPNHNSYLLLGQNTFDPVDNMFHLSGGGQPYYQSPPQSISFYYQFQPGHPTDSLVVHIISVDGNQSDPAGFRIQYWDSHTLPAQNGYQKYIAQRQWTPIPGLSFTTDTLIIAVTYFSADTSAHPTGYALIDQIELQPALGIETPTISGDAKVYPNPATDYVHSSFPEGTPYRIFNITGQRFSGTVAASGQIDLRTLPPGVYFLQATHNGQTRRSRFVKQ